MKRKEQKTLKELRISRNMSQEELAKIMNCAQSTISHWESGRRVPPLSKLRILSMIFNEPIEKIAI